LNLRQETSDAAEASRKIAEAAAPRLKWLDGIKGLAILWIAYFHFFMEYTAKHFPWPLDPHYFAKFFGQCGASSTATMIECWLESIYVAVASVGFHAVGVFVVMSGFGLTYSLARTGNPEGGWREWYRSRVIRLFPMYWLAHIIYLVAPFETHYEPIDYRFALSFLGDRIYPIDAIFYYANAAWWYFDLILELYIVFPLLFRLLQKVNPRWFLIICAAETVLSRYLILYGVIPASGNYLLGGFFGCRLWEFALGMVIGLKYRTDREWIDSFLFSTGTLLGGIALYTAGLYTYGGKLSYTLTDGLLGTGLFVILAHLAWHSRRFTRVEATIAYVGAFSYGLYLIHQPFVGYLGSHIRMFNMLEAAIVGCVVIAILTVVCARLEQYVNGVTNHALARGPKRG
jgi:peptidoglycan/LPS O-acetylase OafA/YrhL